MNRVQHRENLANFLNNSVYYTDIDYNDSIQDGVDEICAFTGAIYRSGVLPFTQYKTYYDLQTLLPDYLGVIAIFNKTIKRFLIPSSLKKFNNYRIDWDTAYGTPEYFAPISYRYVAIFRKPAAAGYGDMVIFYRATAPKLGDNTEIPIPEDHMNCLEHYNFMDLFEQAQEFSKAGLQKGYYEEDLKTLHDLMRGRRNSDRTMGLK